MVVAGLLSAAAGVTHAVTRSQDFQWSGVRMLLDRIDPWQDYLQHDPAHRLIATQVPNYLPVLYVLIAPVCLLPMTAANLTWGICNLAFAIVSAILTARFYGLRGMAWSVGVAAALLAATPTRTTISNGQQGLFVLFLWSLAFFGWNGRHDFAGDLPLSPRRALIAGVSYLKYSFAPAVALYLLLREGLSRGWRFFAWSLLPSALATVLVWLWIFHGHEPGRLVSLVLEPLAVAKSGYQPTSDPGLTMMDLGEFLLGGNLVATPRLTAIVFCVALSITITVLLLALRSLRRSGQSQSREGTGWLLALMAVMSFALYKHHPYDEIVLLLPACYALAYRDRTPAKVALGVIVYHWYLQKLVDGHIPFSFLWSGIRLTSFLVLLAAIYGIHRTPALEEA